MSPARRAIDTLNRISRTVAGAALLALAFVLFFNILGRNFLGRSYIGAETLATYLMVWMTFIGAAFIVPIHGHVAVDLLLRAISTSRFMLRAIVAIVSVCGILISAYMGVFGFELTLSIFRSNQMEPTLGISAGYLYAPIVAGMMLMFVNYSVLLIRVCRGDDSCLPSTEIVVDPSE